MPPRVEVVPTTIIQTALKTETLPGTTIVRTEVKTTVQTVPVTPTVKPKLRVWFRTVFVDPINTYMKSKVFEWALKNDVEVEFTFFSLDELYKKLVSAVEAGNPPDVVYVTGHWAVGLFAEDPKARWLLPLDDVVDSLNRSDIPKNMLKALSIEGVNYGVPVFADTYVIHIRVDLLREAGINVDFNTWTWYDFAEIAKKITNYYKDKGIYGTGITLGKAPDCTNNFVTILGNFGGGVQKERSVKGIIFDSPATYEVVKLIVDLYKSGAMPKEVIGWGDADNNRAYIGGMIASCINPASIMYDLKEKYPEIYAKTLIVPPPRGPGPDHVAYAGVQGLFVFKTTKYPDLAKDLVRFIMMDKGEYLKSCILPSTGYAVPAFLSVASKLPRDKPEWRYVEEITKMGTINYPLSEPTRVYSEVHGRYLISDIFSKIILEGKSVETAIKEVSNIILDIAKSAYGE
ncbi:MAG: extracellular solute-binding protein [Candidatus Methanomethylicaceae archaeon]